jgi:hypothetical protein
MEVADLNRKKRRRKNKRGTGGLKRSDNDPLQNFDGGEVDLDGLAGDDDDDDMPDFDQTEDNREEKKQKVDDDEKKLFANTSDGLGKSTAGRNVWKERHKKGQFSGKKRKSEKKKRVPLGI